MGRTPYKWFNINRIGPGKRINGKSGKAETTIFWPYYSGKCRTVGAYSPRRNHGRATASRQTEKTVDTRHWRVDRLQIHSAKGDVTRSSTMEKKDIGVVICCRQPSSRKVDLWVSEVKRCGCGDGVSLPSPIDLRCRPYNTGHTTVWSCDTQIVYNKTKRYELRDSMFNGF